MKQRCEFLCRSYDLHISMGIAGFGRVRRFSERVVRMKTWDRESLGSVGAFESNAH